MTDSSVVFHHVHLISEDPESAASWYVDNLGAKKIGSNEVLGAPQAIVAFQGATIIIRGRRPGEQVESKQNLQWGTDHFGFQIGGDFDGFCDGLKEKGVTFTMDPTDFTPTVRIAFIVAPDGVSIEILQSK